MLLSTVALTQGDMVHLRLAPDARRVDSIGSYQVCLTSVIRYSSCWSASHSSHFGGYNPNLRYSNRALAGVWMVDAGGIREWTDMESPLLHWLPGTRVSAPKHPPSNLD
jgi:hypothetical protein